MSLHIEITDTKLLKKTIQILSCVIHGHSIMALIRNDTQFFSEETRADLFVIYIKKDEGSKINFLSDKQRLFYKLMEKYNFNKHSPAFDKIGSEITSSLTYAKPYKEVSDLYELLKGTVTKSKCAEMSHEIKFSTALFFPLQMINSKKIGFVGYFYTHKKVPDIEKLKEVSALLQRVIEPLYDFKTSTFYSKCAQIDSDMSRLTSKEREIVYRVIRGVSYKEIAHEQNISINTIKTHMKNIFSKYGVNSKIKLTNKLSVHVK